MDLQQADRLSKIEECSKTEDSVGFAAIPSLSAHLDPMLLVEPLAIRPLDRG
jgi:hypothetical protein